MSEDGNDIFASAAKAGATAGDLSGTAAWYLDSAASRNSEVTVANNQDPNVTATITPAIRNVLAGAPQNGGTPRANTPQVLFQQDVATPAANQGTGVGGGLVPTLSRLMSEATAEEKLHDYMWQPTSGAAGTTEFTEEIVASTGKLSMFALVQEGTPYITVVHGVTKYYNGSVAPELRGKILARTGDWNEEAQPHIIQLAEDVWDWETFKLATDPVQWAAWAAVTDNKGSIWKPSNTCTHEDNVQLPKLLLLPPAVAKYAVEGESPRTAYEIYQFVNRHVQAGTDGVTPKQAKFLKRWLLAAGQQKMGTRSGNSGVVTTVKGITATAPSFLKWAKQRLQTYLQGPTPRTPQTPIMQHHQGTNDAYLLSLTNSISALAAASQKQSTAVAAAAASKNSDEGRVLTEYDLAALKGFSGVETAAECTVFWPLLRTSKSIDVTRNNLMRGMKKWSEATGHEIYKNVRYSDECIKDIMKMDPNPVGTVASLSSSERGVSNMANIPKTPKEIEERKKQEQAARETENNRNFKEALSLLSSTPKRPPENYYSLKLNIATTCAMLFVLFGIKCDMYIKLLGLLNVLKEDDCVDCSGAFTPLLCRQISWAVYTDMRKFFAQKKMPQDFRTQKPTFPKSLLQGIYEAVTYQNPILRSTFPTAWDDKETTQKTPAPKTPTAPAPSPATLVPTPPNKYRTYSEYRAQGGQTTDPTNYGHMNKKLKEAIGPVLEKFKGKVAIQELMTNAGIWWQDLPANEKYKDKVSGQNLMCWNHVVGVCKFGRNCEYADSHVDGKFLPDKFVDETIAVLKPGIDKMLSNEYSRESYARGGLGAAKRFRR